MERLATKRNDFEATNTTLDVESFQCQKFLLHAISFQALIDLIILKGVEIKKRESEIQFMDKI